VRPPGIARSACAALALLSFALPGCSHPEQRIEDALDMADLGLTFSKKPEFAAFKGCAGALSVGFGDVEGYFVGLGHGKLGVTSFSHEGLGLALWGEHKTRFGDASNDDAGAQGFQKTGVLGLADGPIVGPDQEPACIQQLHIGWAGVVANANWLQVADFLLGCTGIDICFDDGKKRGDLVAANPPTAATGPGAKPEPEKPTVVIAQEISPQPTAPADPVMEQIVRERLGDFKAKREPDLAPARGEPKSEQTPEEDPVVIAMSPAPAAPETDAAATYIVKEGDAGLMQIARVRLGDVSRWKEIAKLNRLKHPYVIRIGQELLLPE